MNPDINKQATSPYHDTLVLDFHAAFGHPIEFKPAAPTIEQRALRVRLLAEELTEFARACNVSLQIEQLDTGEYKVLAMQERETDSCDLVEAADALGDLRYVVDGGNLIFGFPGERILAEIHASKMSKLDENGFPITREDGKTLKGPNYRPPNIAGLLGWNDGPLVSERAQTVAEAGDDRQRLHAVMAAVNEHLHPGARCPGAGALGECAAISTLRGHSGHPFYQAHIYLWPAASELEPATIAAWFAGTGCRDITVSAVIHDPENDVVNGVTHDRARPWDVSFLLEQPRPTVANVTDAQVDQIGDKAAALAGAIRA